MTQRTPAIERFWQQVEKQPDGCWQWTGSDLGIGYGGFYVDGANHGVHRWAYEQLRGMSGAAVNARKTHCIHGHPFAGKNLYVNAKGHRICITCRNAANRRWTPTGKKRPCFFCEKEISLSYISQHERSHWRPGW